MYLVWNYLHEWNGRTLKLLFADQWHTFCVETGLSLDFCVSQSYDEKSVSLTGAASSAHRVISDVYLALMTLFLSTIAESPIMENLCSVRIYTSPQPSINCPWITNKYWSIWSCPKMGKYRENISRSRNWISLVRACTGWSLTLAGVWAGFKTAVHFIFKCIKWTCILKAVTWSRNNGRINSMIPGGVCMPRDIVFVLTQKTLPRGGCILKPIERPSSKNSTRDF